MPGPDLVRAPEPEITPEKVEVRPELTSRTLLVAALTGVGMARAELVYLVEVSDLQKKVTREIIEASKGRLKVIGRAGVG